MKLETLLSQIAHGKDSSRQFKADVMKYFGISEFQQKAPNYCNLDVIISVGYRVNPVGELDLAGKGAIKMQDAPLKTSLSDFQAQLLDFIRSHRAVSYDELADMTQKERTTVMRNIGKLKDAGILRRVGSPKNRSLGGN